MSRIEWTDRTWNPTIGCTAVSPGCDGCYAAATAHRGLTAAHRGLTIHTPGQPVAWTGKVRALPERLDIPLGVAKPTRWFIGSMSDLFHPSVPAGFLAEIFARTVVTPRHTYQLLTKRPHRMAQLLSDDAFARQVTERISQEVPGTSSDDWLSIDGGLFANVWAGTSIEADRYTWRARQLRPLQGRVAVRFLSLEPLLGPVPSVDLTGIDWVIVGGESGPRARPMHSDWARQIRDRCVDAGVPFFFKQWGTWAPIGPDPDPSHASPDGEAPWMMAKVAKHTAGRVLDGRTWDQYPTIEAHQ